MIVDGDTAENDKDKSGIFDNMVIAGSSLYFTDTSNTNNKNEYLESEKEKSLQDNSGHCNIIIVDNLLKNMQKKMEHNRLNLISLIQNKIVLYCKF